MSNYEVHKFQLTTFFDVTIENLEVASSSKTNITFQPYIHHNEINQNMSNTSNYENDVQFQMIVPTSIPHNHIIPEVNVASLILKFQSKILYDYPSIPCTYCSMLIMKSSAKWQTYD